MRITHETIYRTIYDDGCTLAVEPRKALRTGRIRRKAHARCDTRKTRSPTGQHISARAPEADTRTVPDHLEGDLIIGEGTRFGMGTLVDRCTRYTKLMHLGTGKDTKHTRGALIGTFASMPDALKRTLTLDQGSEMACHDQFAKVTGIPVYFCNPRGPWQRPTNENTNRLREWLPKGTTCPSTSQRTCAQSRKSSTIGHGKHSAGAVQPKFSISTPKPHPRSVASFPRIRRLSHSHGPSRSRCDNAFHSRIMCRCLLKGRPVLQPAIESSPTSLRFTQRLIDAGVDASTGPTGDSNANEMAESCCSTIKRE